MGSRHCLISTLLFTLSCAVEVALPPAPVTQAPAPDHLEPASAFAGQVVSVVGTHLGSVATDVTIAFGNAVVRPFEASPDGTRLRVVVPDAAFGPADLPILVTTAAGGGPGRTPLHYLGGDRLRMGAVAFARPVSERFIRVAALPSPDSALVVTLRFNLLGLRSSFTESLAYERPGTDEPLPILETLVRSGFAAIASSVDGTKVAVLSTDPNDSCGSGHVTIDFLEHHVFENGVVTWPAIGHACLETIEEVPRLEITSDGSRAVLVNAGRAWLLDPTGGVLPLPSAPDGLHYLSGVPVTNDRFAFLVGDDDEVTTSLLVADGHGSLGTMLAANDPLLELRELDLIAAGPDGLLAVKARQEIVLLNATTWPPIAVRRLRTNETGAGAIRIASDGRSLAALSSRGDLETFDLSRPSPLPAGTRALQDAGTLTADPYGTFFVTSGTSLLRVSATTTATLSTRSFGAQPDSLLWLPEESRALEDGGRETFDLVFAGLRHGEVGRFRSSPSLDPESLDLPLWEPTRIGPVRMSAAARDGRVFAFEDIQGGYWLNWSDSGAERLTFDADFAPDEFALAPDGSALLVVGTVAAGYELRVWALHQGSDPTERARIPLNGLTGTILGIHTWANGRGLVSSMNDRLLFDWDAHAGDASRRHLVAMGEETRKGFVLPDGYLAVGTGNRLRSLDLETGTLTPAGALPATLPIYGETAVSPGGTRLYWAVGDRLVIAERDGVTGRVERIDPPVELPAGIEVQSIAIAPDGEGVAIADLANDTLVIVR